ncbi:HAD-IB family hydrolase [Vibrio cholerae]|uniref:HAD family hydrolase n=2 Tax=Vibrio cholerae TaxID=666 RepID=A0A544C291_VIBCL|nr:MULTISPECIES: HAD family hydrolase [Vibrio]ELJ8547605.1 HAD family hydrolase [Vibrio cholerae]ELY5187522.1 HAD family hydrolase [Vibrio cholerae]ELY5287868.1 HAD family hydrolase [Vibrio cholerae]MBJ6976668.1 HAD family hydrolase [Vibrio cholerae]MBN7279283.1 HAD-IB family hydrolase [Vibrio paracholerae]
MELALFDLDHTLIATDSSAQWWQHMYQLGWLAEPALQVQHQRMMQEYDQGVLDMNQYLDLTLSPLVGQSYAHISQLAQQFVEQHLLSQLYPKAKQLIQEHQQQGRRVIIVSASEDFLVKPWQALLQIDAAIGIGIVTEQGKITGKAIQPLTYREGKVNAIQQWLDEQAFTPSRIYAYSDSHNDLAMFEFADQAFATNPNQQLSHLAEQRDWPVLHFAPDC